MGLYSIAAQTVLKLRQRDIVSLESHFDIIKAVQSKRYAMIGRLLFSNHPPQADTTTSLSSLLPSDFLLAKEEQQDDVAYFTRESPTSETMR